MRRFAAHPDVRQDTWADVPGRIVPRVVVALIGVYLAWSSGAFAQPDSAQLNDAVVAAVLIATGVSGLWVPFVNVQQLIIAGWLAVSCLVFGVRGPAMWNTLAVAAALAAISLAASVQRHGSPMSSFHSSGRSRMKSVMRSKHS